MLIRLLCGLLSSGGTSYEQLLVGEKLKSVKSGNTNIAKTYSNKIVLRFFNCCLSVHVDNYTSIVPTKCTSFY
jgi:hypothetical protein